MGRVVVARAHFVGADVHRGGRRERIRRRASYAWATSETASALVIYLSARLRRRVTTRPPIQSVSRRDQHRAWRPPGTTSARSIFAQ